MALGIEHARQFVVDAAQDRLGEPAGLERQLEAFLQVAIVLEPQPLADFGEEIDDLVHRRVLQVAQQHRIAEHEVVDVLVRIGRAESRAAAALVLDGVLARLDDPAAGDDDRNVVR